LTVLGLCQKKLCQPHNFIAPEKHPWILQATSIPGEDLHVMSGRVLMEELEPALLQRLACAHSLHIKPELCCSGMVFLLAIAA